MVNTKAASDVNLMDNILWIGKKREKAVYYRADGTRTGLLPADPYSQLYYSNKGLSLEPVKEEVEVVISGIKCPYCGFEPKNALGLRTHLNTHISKSEGKSEKD